MYMYGNKPGLCYGAYHQISQPQWRLWGESNTSGILPAGGLSCKLGALYKWGLVWRSPTRGGEGVPITDSTALCARLSGFSPVALKVL